MCPDSHFSSFFFLFFSNTSWVSHVSSHPGIFETWHSHTSCCVPCLFWLCISTFFSALVTYSHVDNSIQASVPYCSPVRGSVINFKDLPLKETFAFLWTRRAVQLYWKAACGPRQRDTPSHPPPSTFWRTAILSSDKVTHFQIIGFLKGMYRTQITPGILFIPLACQVSKG